MIKRDITFFNYAEPPVEVTETFYFNYTKVEGLEIELEYGDLDDTIAELNNTEDVKKAYRLFKEILVGAVGRKVNDNEFDKSEEAKRSFVNSPALSVLIWSFLDNPESAGEFIEGMLPAHDIAEGKARIERERLEAALAAQKNSAPAAVAPSTPEVVAPRTDAEIQALPVDELSNDELSRLVAIRQAAQA